MNRIALLLSVFLLQTACSALPPANVGISNSSLQPCPTTPNCVQSADKKDQSHYIAPIKYIGTTSQAKKNLLNALNSTPDTLIVSIENHYIRAECSSKWLGFIDDVEFLIGDQEVHVRSASRTGYYDLEVNKKRIEAIRQQIEARTKPIVGKP